MRLLVGAFTLAFLLIAGRLTQIEAFGASSMAAYWRGEVTRTVPLQGLRGEILSRDGHLLAVSVSTDEIVADDLQIASPATVAAELAPVLGVPAAQLVPPLSSGSGYVLVAPHVTPAVAAKVEALAAPGITVQPSSQRYYPDGTLASTVIGSVH